MSLFADGGHVPPAGVGSIDPLFLKAVGGKGGFWHVLFLVLVVMNLVAGFQALGTLMSVGLMMLPAITARLWAKSMGWLMILSVALALLCGLAGLLFSYQYRNPVWPGDYFMLRHALLDFRRVRLGRRHFGKMAAPQETPHGMIFQTAA